MQIAEQKFTKSGHIRQLLVLPFLARLAFIACLLSGGAMLAQLAGAAPCANNGGKQEQSR